MKFVWLAKSDALHVTCLKVLRVGNLGLPNAYIPVSLYATSCPPLEMIHVWLPSSLYPYNLCVPVGLQDRPHPYFTLNIFSTAFYLYLPVKEKLRKIVPIKESDRRHTSLDI